MMVRRRTALTERQKEVLNALRSELLKNRYAPTIREIADRCGFSSTSSVKYQLDALEDKGYIVRDPRRPRTILLTELGLENTHRRLYADYTSAGIPRGAAAEEPKTSAEDFHVDPSVNVPVVGRIAAGSPILADQVVEEVLPLPRSLTGDGELFMLKVVGDSMVEAAICDGDWVVIRRQPVAENGEIVAAMIEGEATVKVLQRKDGHTLLLPRNSEYRPIPADDAEVLGRVVTVLRSL
ncbi:repressor LexA [Actinomyces sp. oral taxon 848 str. F0332]|uniref:LexA repressor n=1 Tax=Peptidiphaga gingivicola TaxID=2741497 RepID=A0A179B0S4_9ACTO|nr:transcriptional repressor LexA [Peptidiphaga gingivicola]EEZ77141.1 repressor LexA [Actinomyces sp. oral taxon 848 str. F0332]OAP85316.1 repressor LexA [Peptidiphaga gingivicola]